jgi:bifunctional non-homologous end joining protein LigD
MLATLVDSPFDSREWLFEIKLDGFRAIAELNRKNVEIYSRNFHPFNDRFPNLVQHLKDFNLDAILDGEIVALDEEGVSHFQLLQNYKTEKNIYFYIFDILYLNGEDLRALPLTERKSILKKVLKPDASIRYLDHIETEGKKFFTICKAHGLEGVIGKKKESLYKSGERSKEWVKLKVELRQEVVICGFTEPRNTRKNFGALIVGVYSNHLLHFAGHVGGGFTEKQLDEMKNRLAPLVTDRCPFQTPPHTHTPVTWVKPKFLCEVKFKEWTSEGIMRMPIFLGIRADKPVKAVTREKKEKSVPEEFDFITHRDKLYWEKEKITKGDLLHYYDSVARWILPHLIDRPESLRRFPNGIAKPSFFQKNITSYPEWLSTYRIEHPDKKVNYALIQDIKSLLYVVNLGCIELHSWLSRIQHLEKPDFLIFDLDPEGIAFDAVVTTARALHAILEKIQITSYCKTSGGRGLHIYVPLQGRYTYEQAKRFSELIALLVHRRLPQITSLERSPKKRKKRVYIDCYQNNFGQTIATPYSVRAKPGAPVSTPLSWSEVKRGLNPLNYTIFNTLKRLEKKGDLFKPVLQKGIDLKKSVKLLLQGEDQGECGATRYAALDFDITVMDFGNRFDDR